jgi:hypothetical protein
MPETAPQHNLSPVYPDGDAAMSLQGSITEQMDQIAQRGMTADGGFALTNGAEDDDGAFNVISDNSGELLRGHFDRKGEASAFDAWTERAQVAANEGMLPEGLADIGGRTLIEPGATVAIALNARGVLGQPNILGTLTADGNAATLVEREGALFLMRARTHKDNTTELHAFPVREAMPVGVGKSDVDISFGTKDGLRTVNIDSEASNGPVELVTTPTNHEPASESKRSGRIRGLHKAVMDRKSRTIHEQAGVPELTDGDMNQAINNLLSAEKQAELEAATAAERKVAEQERIENERKAVSISELSAKYPEAGNIFKPGASLYEDDIWQNLQRHYGVDPENREDSGRWKELLANDPKVREYASWVLRHRLDAWCAANPADAVQRQAGAFTKIDQSLGIDRVRAERLQKVHGPDSMISAAATDRKLISNTLPPSHVKANMNKTPKSYTKFNLPSGMRSREYVVALSLAMLDGSFDFGEEERTYQEVHYTNDERNVRVHQIVIAQHRTSAGMIIDGQV